MKKKRTREGLSSEVFVGQKVLVSGKKIRLRAAQKNKEQMKKMKNKGECNKK